MKPPHEMTIEEVNAELSALREKGILTVDNSPPRPFHVEQATYVVQSALGEEFADVPVYLLTDEDIPPTCHVPQCCGWMRPLHDLQHELLLTEMGLWHGRGCCIVVNVPGIRETANLMRRPFELKLFGTALHEAAHWLELTGGNFRLHQRERMRAHVIAHPDAADFVAELLDPTYRPANDPAEDQPWTSHETQFIRLAIHLWWRVRHLQIASGLTLSDLQAAGPRYELSDVEVYRQAVGMELANEIPLRVVANTKPPPAMLNLFGKDIAQQTAAIDAA